MVLHIFHWLPKCNLSNVALVCKRFHQLAQDKCLWTRMDVSGRYLEPGALGRILDRQIVILRLAQSEVVNMNVMILNILLFHEKLLLFHKKKVSVKILKNYVSPILNISLFR